MNISMSVGQRQRSFSTVNVIEAGHPLFQFPLQTGHMHMHIQHRLSQSAASSLEPELRASGVENPLLGSSAATRIPARSWDSAGIPETVLVESPGLTVGPVVMSQVPCGRTKWMLQWPPFISLVSFFSIIFAEILWLWLHSFPWTYFPGLCLQVSPYSLCTFHFP